jgi:hypothetical protein
LDHLPQQVRDVGAKEGVQEVRWCVGKGCSFEQIAGSLDDGSDQFGHGAAKDSCVGIGREHFRVPA